MEINCGALRDLGQGAFADELIERLNEIGGRSALRMGQRCPSVPCRSLVEAWPRARSDIIEPYFRVRMGVSDVQVERPGRDRQDGQGYLADAADRHAIEMRAMELAIQLFRSRSWDVKDVSAYRSYDLHCVKSGEVRRVEVKGTAGNAKSVIMTANEISVATEMPSESILIVVSEIELVRGADQSRIASGGRLREISPWEPDPSDLEVTEYRYTLPPDAGNRE